MLSDIEIARNTPLLPIDEIARRAGIPVEPLEHYGRHIAKLPLSLIRPEQIGKSHLILVTAITPTKAGIGKTTVSVGLALGMNRIGAGRTIVALREPSLGPCFGMKGGAAGGGYAQVLPMERINLHFTGDFHAITSAHNMIAALLDNYLFQHRDDGFALKEVLWKRVLDVNDRALRNIIIGIGGRTGGVVRQTGFDITPASEIMAILCLATDLADLRRRIDNILLGFRTDGRPFRVSDMGIGGAITALLTDAIMPNLVQTTEHTPAIVHGGPFANIAHGCNSVIATRMALSHSDYTITEAGFGADLGAEKFFNIKCRLAGLNPSLTVLVATTQGLKMHGGVAPDALKEPNAEALTAGLANLDKHVSCLRSYGQTVVVALNRYASDTDDELALIERHCREALGVGFAVNNAFAEGGQGAEALASLVVDTIHSHPSAPLHYAYELTDSVEEKIRKIACQQYGAASVSYTPAARKKLSHIAELGYENLPVCMAKTQYSFSTDATRYGVPQGFDLKVRDIEINAGAGMLVVIAGDILRMPGLPKTPQALHIDVVNGYIDGLS